MSSATTSPSSSFLEQELRQVRTHLDRGEFHHALQRARELRLKAPTNRDLLYMIAVSQRYLQLIPDALSTLDELERHHPGYSRWFQERGPLPCGDALRRPRHRGVRTRRHAESVPAGQLDHCSLCFEWWGQAADADHAAAQAAQLLRCPCPSRPPSACLRTAKSSMQNGWFVSTCRPMGNHVEGMRLLAMIGTQLDVLDDAELLLENVLVLAPDHDAARYDMRWSC